MLIKKILIFIIFTTSLALAESKIETPQQLIHTFYEQLDSNKPSKELPRIFEPGSAQGFASALPSSTKESRTDASAATIAVWDYFRANKNIFLFEGCDPQKIIKYGRINYCFTGFFYPETFFNGQFWVELVVGVSQKSGFRKKIYFPLVENENPNPRYLINVCAININGIELDPSNEYDRNENLYQLLGFPVKPEAKKKP